MVVGYDDHSDDPNDGEIDDDIVVLVEVELEDVVVDDVAG